MVTVTADEFQSILNLSDGELSNANAENILDWAIDSLNIFGANLSNLGGTTPNKTLTVTSKQRGAIFTVARKLYFGGYKGVETVGISGVSITQPDLMSDPIFLESVRKIAIQLKSFTFKVAEDTSGIE